MKLLGVDVGKITIAQAAHAPAVLRPAERRRRALPDHHPVRPQRGRRARPGRVRRPRPRHPRLVPPQRPGDPHPDRAHAARRAAPRDPARVLRRPSAPRPDRGARRRGVGGLRHRHRPLGRGVDAVDRAQRIGHGPRGRHADAQLADLRLLPDRETGRRLRLSTASATRSARSSARSRAGMLAYLVRLADAVLRVRGARP